MELNLPKFKKEPNLRKAKVHINPDPYWQVALWTSLAIAVLGCVFGFYLFSRINSEFVALEGGRNATLATVRQERLNDALLYFAERRMKSGEILEDPSPVSDPSI